MAWDRVERAAQAAYVAAAGGAVALVAVALSLVTGGPFGIVANIGFLVMTLAIAPIMLGSYELGGVTPLWPARISLAGGIAAVIVWSVLDLGSILGLVTFDYDPGLTGAAAIESAATAVIGAWLIGAPLLAGPWLPFHLRWLGAVTGLGFFVGGVGLLLGGSSFAITAASGLTYLFPLWAYLVARVFRSMASTPRPAG
jgi:hypothetical protein